MIKMWIGWREMEDAEGCGPSVHNGRAGSSPVPLPITKQRMIVMRKPVNKYCTSCSYYNNDDPDFYKKYGEPGCTGLLFSSAEHPADQKFHCFTDKPLLTVSEIQKQKEQTILEIIKSNTAEEASKQISIRYK